MPTTVFDSESGTNCYRLLSAAASDNATNIIGRPVALKGLQGYNARASAVYLKIYDKATAPASTDTPIKTIYLPTASAFAIDFPEGIIFQNGLGFRLTTGVADNDTGALASGDVLALNVDYAG